MTDKSADFMAGWEARGRADLNEAASVMREHHDLYDACTEEGMRNAYLWGLESSEKVHARIASLTPEDHHGD